MKAQSIAKAYRLRGVGVKRSEKIEIALDIMQDLVLEPITPWICRELSRGYFRRRLTMVIAAFVAVGASPIYFAIRHPYLAMTTYSLIPALGLLEAIQNY